MMGELFSFKGEVGRGRFWLIYFGIGISSVLVGGVCSVLSEYVGGAAFFDPTGRIGWPQTQAGWIPIFIYWVLALPLFWVFAAAFVKRLRDVGIGAKWAVILVVALVLAIPTAELLTGDATQIPDWKAWIVLVIMSPACLLGMWLLGSAFFAPGHKSRRIDPAQLSEGWKS